MYQNEYEIKAVYTPPSGNGKGENRGWVEAEGYEMGYYVGQKERDWFTYCHSRGEDENDMYLAPMGEGGISEDYEEWETTYDVLTDLETSIEISQKVIEAITDHNMPELVKILPQFASHVAELKYRAHNLRAEIN